MHLVSRTVPLSRWPLLGMLCCVAIPAQADLAIKLARISDTEVFLTATGTLDSAPPDSNPHALFMMDPFQVRPTPTANNWVLDESDLRAGSFTFNFANEAGSDIGLNSNRPPGTPGVSGFANTIYLGHDDFVAPLPAPFQPIPTNVPLDGSMLLSLTSGSSFAAVGSRGDVHWGITLTQITFPGGSGFTQQDKGVLVGSWEMVSAPAVPEPAVPAMLLAGLGLLGLLARHRQPDPCAGATCT